MGIFGISSEQAGKYGRDDGWMGGWRERWREGGSRSFRPFGPTMVEVVGYRHQRDRVSNPSLVPFCPSSFTPSCFISQQTREISIETEQIHDEITDSIITDNAAILRGDTHSTDVR